MIRVLLMIDEATPGGGQKHLLDLASGLDRRQFEVAVACAQHGYLVDELEKRSIRTFPLRMTNTPDPSSIFGGVRLLRKYDPSILHTHGGTAGFVGRTASIFVPRVSVVHTYHGIHYLHEHRSFRKRLFRRVDALLMKRTDTLICVAQSDYDLGMRHGIVDPHKTIVVRNGVDPERFSSLIHEGRKPYPIIGTIGRLHVQKGHRYLIEAAGIILKQYPGSSFRITGEGPLRRELESLIKAGGVEGSVVLTGERTDPDQIFREIDIFLLPSLWEGLPLVLLEAMAAGLPVVATGVDGVNEVVEDGVDALVVPAADPRRLADGVIRLLQDPVLARQLGENAARKVKREFSLDRMIRETEQAYLKLVNEVRE